MPCSKTLKSSWYPLTSFAFDSSSSEARSGMLKQKQKEINERLGDQPTDRPACQTADPLVMCGTAWGQLTPYIVPLVGQVLPVSCSWPWSRLPNYQTFQPVHFRPKLPVFSQVSLITATVAGSSELKKPSERTTSFRFSLQDSNYRCLALRIPPTGPNNNTNNRSKSARSTTFFGRHCGPIQLDIVGPVACLPLF